LADECAQVFLSLPDLPDQQEERGVDLSEEHSASATSFRSCIIRETSEPTNTATATITTQWAITTIISGLPAKTLGIWESCCWPSVPSRFMRSGG
jgi:hypothetical protein